jgi:hypothetical protein
LVRKVLDRVPQFISRQLVKEMMLKDDDWEVALPFTLFLKKLESSLKIAEECENIGSSYRFKHGASVDQISAIGEIRSPWLEEWRTKFKNVLYCSGPGHRDELLKLARVNDNVEVKTFDKGKRGPYALLGCKTDDRPILQCYSREFTFKPKN